MNYSVSLNTNLSEFKKAFFVSVFLILCLFANAINSSIGFCAFLLFSFFLLIESTESAIEMIYFLIPMIGILDCTGLKFLINILIYICCFKYLMKYRNKIQIFVLNTTVFTIFYGVIHIFFYPVDSMMGEIISVLKSSFTFFIAFSLIMIKSRDFNYLNCSKYLIVGLLASAIISLISGDSNINLLLMATGLRFCGYARDPNFFNLYLIQSIVYLLLYSPYFDIKKLILCFVMLGLGILTLSKTFILNIAIVFLFSFYVMILKGRIKRINKILIVLFIIAIVACIFLGEQLLLYIETLGKRKFQGADNTSLLDKLTSGRINLWIYYCKALIDNPLLFLFGAGLSYRKVFDPMPNYGVILSFGKNWAHNTFLDIFIGEGVVGIIIIFILFVYFHKTIVRKITKSTIYNSGAFIAYIIAFTGLSCLNSDMFFLLLSFSLLPLINTNIVCGCKNLTGQSGSKDA